MAAAMATNPWHDSRCSYCLKFLRGKSLPIPEGVCAGAQRLGPRAAQQAETALRALNVLRTSKNEPVLSFEDSVFVNRLHYRDGKTCYATVEAELKAELATKRSTRQTPAWMPAPKVQRAPPATEAQRLAAGAGELDLEALFGGGTMTIVDGRTHAATAPRHRHRRLDGPM